MNLYPISGVILAGGQSKRFGSNKALIDKDGIPLLQYLVNQLEPLFNEIIISTGVIHYDFIKQKQIKDIFQFCGPLGGIHSALVHSLNDKIFVISCDLPNINTAFIREFCQLASNYKNSILRINDKIQPLCGIYHKENIFIIQQIINSEEVKIDKRKLSMFNFINYIQPFIIEASQMNSYNKNILLNINTPEDYAQYLKNLRS